jgi:hypothetical protein
VVLRIIIYNPERVELNIVNAIAGIMISVLFNPFWGCRRCVLHLPPISLGVTDSLTPYGVNISVKEY